MTSYISQKRCQPNAVAVKLPSTIEAAAMKLAAERYHWWQQASSAQPYMQ